jgi:2-dehydro-3-deoxyphosphooctonate aldolase (KDO 8-P synthase)
MNTLYEKFQTEFCLIAGPCVIESEELVLQIASKVQQMAERLGITYVFKASFDKANRSSLDSFRGPGLAEGLKILEKVKRETGLSVLTDIHESSQAAPVAEVADVLQIPAFLCRQTDLLVAAAETGKIVNIKKAQFLTGQNMFHPAEKVRRSGNDQIMLTERGNMFGNNDLVVDFRNILEMQKLGYPVVMDVTHSVQKPAAAGSSSGGNREYARPLARAAAAVGVKAFFIETHPEPEKALSDGPNMIPLGELEEVLSDLLTLSALSAVKK